MFDKLVQKSSLILVLLLTSIFNSCNSNEVTVPMDPAKNQLITQLKKLVGPNEKEPNKGEENFVSSCITTYSCFEYVFPLKVTKGSSTVTMNSDEELTLFYASLNPGAVSYFVFPIQVKYFGGSRETADINNYSELNAAYDSCKERISSCFYLNFPLQLTDGNLVKSVANELEMGSFYREIPDPTKVDFVYPMTVTYTTTKQVINVKDGQQFDNLYKDCSRIANYDFLDSFRCFEFQFPINALEGGKTITMNDKAALLKYFKGLNKTKEPALQFPIQLKMADNSLRYVYSQNKLEALFDMCFDATIDKDDCFVLEYPITADLNQQSKELTSDTDLFNLLDGIKANDRFNLTYPVHFSLGGKTGLTISNDQEFTAILSRCN